MPTVPPLEALKIQVRAVTADDNCLAQAALDRAAQDHFPSESSYHVLEQMRTRDLLRLVSIHVQPSFIHEGAALTQFDTPTGQYMPQVHHWPCSEAAAEHSPAQSS